ncbi:MAG: hypothetical protein JRH20_17975 [Deltaproteobacteria bacterium]|nr:hypothetical protein [Deltaproteobacteria bacterium]
MRCQPHCTTITLLSLFSTQLLFGGCGKVLYGDLDAGPLDHSPSDQRWEQGNPDQGDARVDQRDTAPDEGDSRLDAPLACPQSGACLITVAGSGDAGAMNGLALQAEFDQPIAVGMGGQGEVLVVDFSNHLLRKINNGQVSTLAGSGWGDAIGPLLEAKFAFPEDLSSGGGMLFIANTRNDSIRQVSTTNVQNVAGSSKGFVEGPVADAQFNHPCGLTHDSSGVIYVADRGNNVIRQIKEGVVSTLIGDSTEGDKNGPGSSAQLNAPSAVAVDDSGKLYVADTNNNKIKVYDPSSGLVSTLAGDGHHGYLNGDPLSARFAEPESLVVTPDGATVYVADTHNHCIRKIAADPVGEVSTVAGQCTKAGFADGAATTEALLNSPHGVTLTDALNSTALTIADTDNNRVRELINK